MSESCEHEYVEPVEHELTGDLIHQCCDCGVVTGFGGPENQTRPDHWFKHPRDRHVAENPIKISADVIHHLDLPHNPYDDRYIHACGSCGHWLGAVHSSYFDDMSAPLDEGNPSDFVGAMMESLCPKCGDEVFRYTSVLMTHTVARELGDALVMSAPEVVVRRANTDYWHSNRGNVHIDVGSAVGMQTRYIDEDYACRCPACGFAKSYGGREFDFHHWDYEEDIGCMLCRQCHDHIHRSMRAREQGKLTDSWKRDAIRRLYERSTDNGLVFDAPAEFTRRFNIRPLTPELSRYISGVVDDE